MRLAFFVTVSVTQLCSSTSSAVAHDFNVPLSRDSLDLTIEGFFRRTGYHPLGLDRVRRRTCRLPIRSSGCGRPLPQTLFRITGTAQNQTSTRSFDAINMCAGSPQIRCICIGFAGRWGGQIDSLIYTSTESGEALILSPEDPQQYAVERNIFYATVRDQQMMFVSMSLSDAPDQMINRSTFMMLSLHVNERDRSTIAPHIYDQLVSRLSDLGASLIIGGPNGDIAYDNCYERLVPLLPDIIYRFANDAESESVSGELVFSAADYLEPRSDSRGCNLLFFRGREGQSITLMDDLVRKVGGVLFDYRNNRIGFFDPL